MASAQVRGEAQAQPCALVKEGVDVWHEGGPLGIDLAKLDIIVLKSRVHFWRGFVDDGLAKTVVVIDAPGLGPAM